MSNARARICVLASGGGSNLGAMLDHGDQLGDARTADVVLVVSNRPTAGAISRATERGIDTAVIAPGSDEGRLEELLAQRRIDLVVLAGYLRLVPRGVTSAYRGRLINIHPALLPAFGGPGMFGHRVHQAVLDAGVRLTGATVHFVDEHYDRGPIIAQWPVPVLEGDTPESLAARVLQVEHALLPRVVEAIAARRIWLADDGRVAGLPSSDSFADAGFAFAARLAEAATGLDALLPGARPQSA